MRIFPMLLIVLASTGCATVGQQPTQGDVVISRNLKYGLVTMGQRIGPAIEDGFRPGEEIILGTTSISGGAGQLSIEVPIVYHAGRIEEIGAYYRFFKDGSGGVDGWSTSCKTDKITDKSSCTLTSNDAKIIVIYTGSGKPRGACAFGHDFPGRVGALRVDQNKPIRTNVDGCISGSNLHRFLAQMRNGSTTVARAVEWPYDYNRDTTADNSKRPVWGLWCGEAFAYCAQV